MVNQCLCLPHPCSCSASIANTLLLILQAPGALKEHVRLPALLCQGQRSQRLYLLETGKQFSVGRRDLWKHRFCRDLLMHQIQLCGYSVHQSGPCVARARARHVRSSLRSFLCSDTSDRKKNYYSYLLLLLHVLGLRLSLASAFALLLSLSLSLSLSGSSGCLLR